MKVPTPARPLRGLSANRTFPFSSCIHGAEGNGRGAVQVPVLFVCQTSPYRDLGCDVYDLARDARSYSGDLPVIAHPPCRAWGRYKSVAKPRPGEKDLSPWAVNLVRSVGGVVEHPISSSLWPFMGCASWGVRDQWGGVLVPVAQSSYGHQAQKLTGLYIVGFDVPTIADPLPGVRPLESMHREARERTPEPFARFLISILLSKNAEGNGRGGFPLAGGTAHGAAGAQLSAAPLGNHGETLQTRRTTA